jgi:V/A-type H+-transporting ATPase subunit C
MNDLGARHSGIELLEYATYMNMSKQFRSILESANGELKSMISAYLTKWDFENLKVVLRGRNYGLSPDKIREDLVIAGSLKEDDIERIMAAPSIEDVLTIFKSKTGLSVSDEAIHLYKEENVLTRIEDELTIGYYKGVLDSITGKDRATNIFRTYIKYVIDLKNIETIMKFKMENVDGSLAADYFIPGGAQLDEKTFAQANAAPTIEAAFNELQSMKIFEELKTLLSQAPTVSLLVLTMERFRLKMAIQVSHMYPLSVIPVVVYMIMKEDEVKKIRTVAHGINSGLDRDTIKNLLVI